MSTNNLIAAEMEEIGVRTFSTQEMAFNILGLLHPTIANACQDRPIWADLNGGLQYVRDLKLHTTTLRTKLLDMSLIKKAIIADQVRDFVSIHGEKAERKTRPYIVKPRANMRIMFPTLKSYEMLTTKHLQGMLDLSRVIVVTGIGEVGPWGSCRTRWEMEAYGKFSLEGCIELAWVTGLIRFHNGTLSNGEHYTGWVDAKTKEPVEDYEIKNKYENHIIEHSGIRIIGEFFCLRSIKNSS